MKKIILITSFLLLISYQNTFADSSYINKSGFDLYKEIIQRDDYCAQYKKTDANNEKIVILDESKYFLDLDSNTTKGYKIGDDLKIAKRDYEKNMDTLFGCATYSSYYRSLKIIKDDLIKRNPKLNSRLKSKIEQKMAEIERKASKLDGKCKLSGKKNDLVKKAVLEQGTYELCKYNYYLEYLKDHNQKITNLVDTKGKESIGINQVTSEFNSKINSINTEIDRAYQAFPMAIKAYNDYENNIGVHILLELLKEDYIVFRIGLHKTLNPINQVVYKISNAMRK